MKIPDLLSLKKTYSAKEGLFKKYGIDAFFIKIYHKGITPTLLTALSVASIYMSVIALFNNHTLFILGVLLHLFFDALDGYSARVTKTDSKFGEWLDHGGDFSSGVFMLLKTYYVLGTDLALKTLVLFSLELIAIYINKWKYHFPARLFMFLYIFHWYEAGLIVQIIYTTFSILYTMYQKKSVRYD